MPGQEPTCHTSPTENTWRSKPPASSLPKFPYGTDCQSSSPTVSSDFPGKDDSFDRVLAIHLLEHLYNLPVALDEVARVLRPGGVFSVVIPCEGGRLYSLGRQFTTKRIFEKRYQVPYEWMIRQDHCNSAREVLSELASRFRVRRRSFFPCGVPGGRHELDDRARALTLEERMAGRNRCVAN